MFPRYCCEILFICIIIQIFLQLLGILIITYILLAFFAYFNVFHLLLFLLTQAFLDF